MDVDVQQRKTPRVAQQSSANPLPVEMENSTPPRGYTGFYSTGHLNTDNIFIYLSVAEMGKPSSKSSFYFEIWKFETDVITL